MKPPEQQHHALSGWCSGPPGARLPHEKCRWADCGCDCHKEDAA